VFTGTLDYDDAGQLWDKTTYFAERAQGMKVQRKLYDDDLTNIINHPLFLFGDESDMQFDRWAEDYADSTRRQSLWEMQAQSARDLFGTGNSLWLRVVRPAPDGICPICWQLLEGEQLDDSKDQPARPGQNRIEHGIEYNEYGEPVAYWLFDAHPYDSMQWGARLLSRRNPSPRRPAGTCRPKA
jgi:capsid protein